MALSILDYYCAIDNNAIVYKNIKDMKVVEMAKDSKKLTIDDKAYKWITEVKVNKKIEKKTLWDTAEQTWVEVDKTAISKKKVKAKTKKEVVALVLETVFTDFRDKKIDAKELKEIVDIVKEWRLSVEGRRSSNKIKKVDRFGFISFEKEE
jgi:hypothetical protein